MAARASLFRHAMRLCLGRDPTPEDLADGRALYQAQRQILEVDPDAAAHIAGSHPFPAGTDSAELGSWVLVGRTLMNLDEFITKE